MGLRLISTDGYRSAAQVDPGRGATHRGQEPESKGAGEGHAGEGGSGLHAVGGIGSRRLRLKPISLDTEHNSGLLISQAPAR